MDWNTHQFFSKITSWFIHCFYSGGYLWSGKAVAAGTFPCISLTTAQCFWRSNCHFRYWGGCRVWSRNFPRTWLGPKLLRTNFTSGITSNFSKSQIADWKWFRYHAPDGCLATSASCNFRFNLSRLDCSHQSTFLNPVQEFILLTMFFKNLPLRSLWLPDANST